MSATVIEFQVNGQTVRFEGDDNTPLLWVIRDHLNLTGTKFGCGMAQCGACSVHMDGIAIRSCVKRVRDVAGKSVTTIEGLSHEGGLHPLQKVWIEDNVPQCGYCQSGQLMCAAALLKAKPSPTDADIDVAMAGNLCRCGTYPRIKKAIKKAATEL